MSAPDNGDDTREEYDFSGGGRGKYAARFAAGTNVVVLDPDVAETFKTSRQVNDALRRVKRDADGVGSGPPNTVVEKAGRRHED